jgi:hypothetical protein
MPYKFEIRRKPGRAMRVVADVLLALACFGALQTLETTATATSVAASATQPSGSFLAVELPAGAQHSQGVRETVVGDIEHATAAAKSGDASLSITASSLPGFVTAMASDDMLYRKARSELLKAWSAERKSWSRCTHAGYGCRKLQYETGDGRKGMARLYLHDGVLVVVNAVYTEDEELARKFLASAH